MSAVLLIAGTTVGAGILAIPSVTQESGFLASSVACIGCWLYMVRPLQRWNEFLRGSAQPGLTHNKTPVEQSRSGQGCSSQRSMSTPCASSDPGASLS